MRPPVLTRRGLVSAGAALIGAALLPIGVVEALPAGATPTEALPSVFDPAAFVAELTAAGYGVSAYRDVPRGGEVAGPPTYLIRPPRGRGFGAAYFAVMARWGDAMDACPDHVERVVDYAFGQLGGTS